MGIRTAISIILLIGIVTSGAAQDGGSATKPSPFASLEKRLGEHRTRLARDHVGIARFAISKKLFAQAIIEFERALEMDPQNPDAKDGLQLKTTKDETPVDALTRVNNHSELSKRRAQTAAKALTDLASYAAAAKEAGAEQLAKDAYKIMLNYDSRSALAQKGLGRVLEGERFVDIGQLAIETRAREILANTADGAADATPHSVEKKLELTFQKVKSPRFNIIGVYNITTFAAAAKGAEAARSLTLELLNLKDADIYKPMTGVYLLGRDQHEKFVDRCTSGDEARKRGLKQFGGCWFSDPRGTERWLSREDAASIGDHAVHYLVGHQTILSLAGTDPPAWLCEGFACWLTLTIHRTAMNYCASMETGVSSAKPKETDDWYRAIGEQVRFGKDKPLRGILKLNYNNLASAETLKAWSVVDFCIRERPDQFVAFAKMLRKEPRIEIALQTAFGVAAVEDLDTLWRAFVREKY